MNEEQAVALLADTDQTLKPYEWPGPTIFTELGKLCFRVANNGDTPRLDRLRAALERLIAEGSGDVQADLVAYFSTAFAQEAAREGDSLAASAIKMGPDVRDIVLAATPHQNRAPRGPSENT